MHCNTLQHTATHCSTLQHSATHCNTLQQYNMVCKGFWNLGLYMCIYVGACVCVTHTHRLWLSLARRTCCIVYTLTHMHTHLIGSRRGRVYTELFPFARHYNSPHLRERLLTLIIYVCIYVNISDCFFSCMHPGFIKFPT